MLRKTTSFAVLVLCLLGGLEVSAQPGFTDATDLLVAVPAEAHIVAVGDLAHFNDVVPVLPPQLLSPDGLAWQALQAALPAGFEAVQIAPTHVAAFLVMNDEPYGAVILAAAVTGTPTAVGAHTYRDTTLYALDDDLYMVINPEGLVLGTLGGVTAVLDTFTGSVPSFHSVSSDLLSRAGGGAVTLLGRDLANAGEFGEALPVSQVVVTLSGERSQIVIDFGQTAVAEMMESMVRTQLEETIVSISAIRNEWETDTFLESWMQELVAVAGEDLLVHGVEVSRDGGWLSVSANVTATTTWLGMSAAIAIPAFLRYISRSKTTEAVQNLRRLYDSSVSYYDSNHVSADGSIVPTQFPDSQPMTPAVVPCGDMAAPNAEDWYAPTWNALNFAVSDPHYFSYQYDSSGTGEDSTFTASAFGDLDCDGVYSTFVRVGEVTYGNEVRGGAGIYQSNELE